MSDVGSAVFFREEDYSRAGRRAVSAFVDFVLLMFLYSAVWAALSFEYVPKDVREMPPTRQKQKLVSKYMQPIARPLFFGWLAICYFYHVGLRRLSGRTFGHLLTGTRIVDAAGVEPSWKALTKRFAIAVPTVIFFGLPYLGCRKGPGHRAFHDIWCGTWVVRRSARPVGPARIVYQTKLLGTWLLTYTDVEPLPGVVTVVPDPVVVEG